MNVIKKIMLGNIPNSISLVIITPLQSTYHKLKNILNIEEMNDKCFFDNCIFKINEENKKGILVLSPQGISAKDIIELFENTDILFFGLAGSLNPKFEIGTFLEVKTAVDEEKNNFKLVTTGNYETVKCGYSPCMLGTVAKKHCDFSRELKCDVVDMETVYCAKTAIEKNNRFTSLLLISDIPEIINFWELSDETRIKLKEQRKVALEKIVDYIRILTENK